MKSVQNDGGWQAFVQSNVQVHSQTLPVYRAESIERYNTAMYRLYCICIIAPIWVRGIPSPPILSLSLVYCKFIFKWETLCAACCRKLIWPTHIPLLPPEDLFNCNRLHHSRTTLSKCSPKLVLWSHITRFDRHDENGRAKIAVRVSQFIWIYIR